MKIEVSRPAWRPRRVEGPEELWERFIEYAVDVEENPLYGTKVFCYKGEIIYAKVRKERPMTIGGFTAALGITPRAWRNWRASREDLAEIIERIEQAMFVQRFCLAAVGMIKANLISREIGLANCNKSAGSANVTLVPRH